MKKQIGLMTLSLMLVSPALAGGAGAPVGKNPTCKSVEQIVTGNPELSTLATAINAAGLKNALSSAGSLTVFAPTNAAFSKVPSDTLTAALNDPSVMRGLVLYHVVGEKATAKQIRGVRGGTTLQGSVITVSTQGNKLMINNATVTKADLIACNGIVHVIDTVLLPPVAATVKAPTATLTPAAPTPAVPTTTPPAPAPAMTVTIPALPASGALITTTTSTITTTNATTAAANTSTTATSSATVYDVLVNNERFSTVRELISDAGLTDSLMTGEYTIFAPTNDAFDNLPDGVLAAVRSDPKALKQLLQYHVLARRVTTSQISEGKGLTTLQGTDIDLGSATLGTVLTSGNGLIYPIDAVLLPTDFVVPDIKAVAADTTPTPPNIATYLTTDPQLSTLRDLLNTAGLSDTLTSGDYTIFAPTNDAFAKLDQAKLAAWRKNKAQLKTLLQGLIVTGHPDAAGLSAAPLKTLEGSEITITRDGASLKYGDAVSNGKFTTTATGNVYIIDTVPVPASLR
ncbi:fasciclin domain-containing protein [Deinococcus sp.]|uniref:fasciclin domain-containing protein n=1 Tax=Deinococcus sp. TaxID=47478 RepID=UPI0025BCBA76|nr:fasciclin domain-containing protein [Deinococcus sp.]